MPAPQTGASSSLASYSISGQRESNPCSDLGKVECCRNTLSAYRSVPLLEPLVRSSPIHAIDELHMLTSRWMNEIPLWAKVIVFLIALGAGLGFALLAALFTILMAIANQ